MGPEDTCPVGTVAQVAFTLGRSLDVDLVVVNGGPLHREVSGVACEYDELKRVCDYRLPEVPLASDAGCTQAIPAVGGIELVVIPWHIGGEIVAHIHHENAAEQIPGFIECHLAKIAILGRGCEGARVVEQ